ncbi:hypothetical protein DL89DRAFT_159798 [Linderina pennispora]|uniref:Uncharacterized protein n=1 Tax=Linderina pennispora TaxID=61395 RepID=A0A1Y1VU98_9FUNG|nr:uncharacterized protein DL89DRAFT_159798 [Linderina pennispora]ORX64753.1 hypothetical protein DL89DRAFT_159798 [Linderina pennispora]
MVLPECKSLAIPLWVKRPAIALFSLQINRSTLFGRSCAVVHRVSRRTKREMDKKTQEHKLDSQTHHPTSTIQVSREAANSFPCHGVLLRKRSSKAIYRSSAVFREKGTGRGCKQAGSYLRSWSCVRGSQYYPLSNPNRCPAMPRHENTRSTAALQYAEKLKLHCAGKFLAYLNVDTASVV